MPTFKAAGGAGKHCAQAATELNKYTPAAAAIFSLIWRLDKLGLCVSKSSRGFVRDETNCGPQSNEEPGRDGAEFWDRLRLY
jgi:hypothetical protein